MRLKHDCEVLVTGAGPVGLFAALSLAERGVDVQIIDKEWRGSAHSYALALHPEALRLLDGFGLADTLVENGQRIQRLAVYVGNERVGQLDLSALGGPFPFLLVTPQSTLEKTLETYLKKKKVEIHWNHQTMALDPGDEGVGTKVALMEKYSTGYPVTKTEWMIAKEFDVQAKFVLGADGYHSFVRKSIGSRFEHLGSGQTFSVFEFPCAIDFADEARVVFREDSANVLWPLDKGRGRWSFEIDPESPPEPSLKTLNSFVRERAPWFGKRIEEINWHTTVMFERRLADPIGRGRVVLAGDSAHITGPVGGQSMNIGLREAHDLAAILQSILKEGGDLDLLERYETERSGEWRRLLDPGDGLKARDDAPQWASSHADHLLPCVPASGKELDALLAQVGLELG